MLQVFPYIRAFYGLETYALATKSRNKNFNANFAGVEAALHLLFSSTIRALKQGDTCVIEVLGFVLKLLARPKTMQSPVPRVFPKQYSR